MIVAKFSILILSKLIRYLEQYDEIKSNDKTIS